MKNEDGNEIKLINTDFPKILMDQLLRSETSVCANVEEPIGGQTKKDFSSKIPLRIMKVEKYYWLRLIKDSRSMSEGTPR